MIYICYVCLWVDLFFMISFLFARWFRVCVFNMQKRNHRNKINKCFQGSRSNAWLIVVYVRVSVLLCICDAHFRPSIRPTPTVNMNPRHMHTVSNNAMICSRQLRQIHAMKNDHNRLLIELEYLLYSAIIISFIRILKRGKNNESTHLSHYTKLR